jgi:hypothetical protein
VATLILINPLYTFCIMRMSSNHYPVKLLLPGDPENVISQIIKMERLTLEANTVINNEHECLQIKHRIADAKILLLAISGDLPS